MIAVALLETCEALCGGSDRFALKWPNDVLLNGGKLAGILLEGAGKAGAMSHLAIGVGVNLAAAPDSGSVEPGAVPPVSLLSETGCTVDPETFLSHLAPAYARLEDRFVTYGFEPIRIAWLARAARLGEVITARTARSESVGTFETVDADGNLVLKTAKDRVSIAAADVFF